MNTFIKILAISASISSFAVPVFAQEAQEDPTDVACSDYSKKDQPAKIAATVEFDSMMAMTPEEQKMSMEMTAEQRAAHMADMQTKMDAMTDDEKATMSAATEASIVKIMAACEKMPDATIAEAIKAAM